MEAETYTANRLTLVVLYRNLIDATVPDTASLADPSLSAAAPIRSSALTDPTFLLNFHPSRSCPWRDKEPMAVARPMCTLAVRPDKDATITAL